jgi:hypothetical protein
MGAKLIEKAKIRRLIALRRANVVPVSAQAVRQAAARAKGLAA